MTAPPTGPGELPFQPEYPIRTERLLLRPYRPDDVDAVYAYERLPETARYLAHEPMSRAEAQALVTRRIGSSTLGGVGEVVNMVVELAQTGVLVGDCVLFCAPSGTPGKAPAELSPAVPGGCRRAAAAAAAAPAAVRSPVPGRAVG